jgi:hypothetical protein
MDIPKVDFSKAPHPSLVNATLLFVPGIFVEMAIYLGNPDSLRTLNKTLDLPAGSQIYFWILVSVLIAFLLGGLGEAWLRAIRIIVNYIYDKSDRLRKRLTIWPRQKPPIGNLKIRGRILGWLNRIESSRNVGVKAGHKVWTELATSLLKRRFGITLAEPLQLSPEWGAWYDLLEVEKADSLRTNRFQKTFHAIGWYGIASLRFAPSLWDRYFVISCLFLIVTGIHQEWLNVKRFRHPSWLVGSHVFALMLEFPPLQTSVDDCGKNDDAGK